MVTAESTHGINEPVHVLQGHPVHGFVEGVEVRLGLGIVQVVDLAVGFVEKRQDGIAVAEVWWILRNVGFEFLEIGFQHYHLRSVGDSNSGSL